MRDIHRIEAESTGSVLMARLIEDDGFARIAHPQSGAEVHPHPHCNRELRRPTGLRLHLQRQRHVKHAIRWFRREDDAALAPRPSRQAWVASRIARSGKHGRGQTIEDDQRDAHNEAMNALVAAAQTRETWAILDRGRSDEERAIVLMENEHVKGWCFTDATVSRYDEIPELVELKNGSATADAIAARPPRARGRETGLKSSSPLTGHKKRPLGAVFSSFVRQGLSS